MALIQFIAFFCCYKYNFFSKKIYNFCTSIKKKCKIKTSVSWVCLLLILMKDNKWSLFLLPCLRRKLQWVACCESDNIGSGVGIVYCCHLYLPPPHPCFLSAPFPSHYGKEKFLYASFETWLAQEEKLSYKESLKDSKLSTPSLSELLKDVSWFFSFSSFRPSTLLREFFSFSNKITVLLLYLLNDSREILDNLFSGSSFVSSTCFNFWGGALHWFH